MNLPLALQNTWLVVLLCLSAQAAEPSADDILKASSVRGGLVVHLGCGDGKLTAALRANDSYLVHGLVRVARTCSVRDAVNHESKRRNNRYTFAVTALERPEEFLESKRKNAWTWLASSFSESRIDRVGRGHDKLSECR